MPGRPMTEEQKRKKREREGELTTKRYTSKSLKKLLHKFFSWTLNRLLFLRMSYFKWMHISETWFNRFFSLFRNEIRIFIVNWN